MLFHLRASQWVFWALLAVWSQLSLTSAVMAWEQLQTIGKQWVWLHPMDVLRRKPLRNRPQGYRMEFLDPAINDINKWSEIFWKVCTKLFGLHGAWRIVEGSDVTSKHWLLHKQQKQRRGYHVNGESDFVPIVVYINNSLSWLYSWGSCWYFMLWEQQHKHKITLMNFSGEFWESRAFKSTVSLSYRPIPK